MQELHSKYSYLDYLERPLDPQQLAVCCRTDNSIVAAGAGSGKTQVLATRFAWLCMEFDDITADSILTLTFTKKAANEMYFRIYKTLKRFSEAPEDIVPERQKKNALKALESFSKVHIQTLDSYCGTIVRQGANRYGIRPDFTTGQAQKDIYTKALSFVLKNINNPGIQHFAKPGKIQEFAEKFFGTLIIQNTSIACEKDYFTSKLKIQKEQIVNEWNNLVTSTKDGSLLDILNNLSVAFEDPDVKDYIKTNEALTGVYESLTSPSKPELKVLQIEKVFDSHNTEILEYINSVHKWLSDISSFRRSPKKLAMIQVINESRDKIKGEKGSSDSILKTILSIYSYIQDYEYIVQLFSLLDEFTQEINRYKRISGQLSFKDVSEMALKILIEQKDIRTQEKQAYKKIMIDEFQDNNGKNRDLLFLLSEKPDVFTTISNPDDSDELHRLLINQIVKDKLFFVGDEKQSIYKFRGADVAVFNQLKDDLIKINGPESSLYMIYNYRSAPSLLSSFNQIFGGWKASDNDFVNLKEKNRIFLPDSSESFEALYPKNSVARFVDKDHNEVPPVQLNDSNIHASIDILLSNKQFKDDLEKKLVLNEKNQTAYYLAKKISSLVKSGVPYDKIAILDKSRTNRDVIKLWLERFEIPYKLDEQTDIFNDGPVNDIYNFLRLCIYPSDQLAMATYLCSPFAGFSEQELEQVLIYASSLTSENTLIIQQKFGINSELSLKFKSACDFYMEQQPLILSRPICDTLNFLWYECGYRYETMLNSSVKVFAEQYDFLFELARQTDLDGRSVDWFIDQLAQIKEEADADMDVKEVSYPLEMQSAVQIMTIHKSKGLQFDYVFILGCLGSTRNESQDDYFYDETYGVSVRPKGNNPNYFYIRQQNENKLKTQAEYRRLIYVGLTRAIKNFYVLGSISVSDKESTSESTFIKDLVSSYYPDYKLTDQNTLYEQDAPFILNIIPSVSKEEIFSSVSKINLNSSRREQIKQMEKLIEKISSDKNEGNIIETPVLLSNRITPSSLEELSSQELQELPVIPSPCKELYPEIDSLINSSNSSLGYDEFGTIVHKYLEYSVGNKNLEFLLINDLQKFSKLTDKQRLQIHELIKQICNKFSQSSYGLKAQEAIKNNLPCYQEYSFKMFDDGLLVTGSIDLFYKNVDGSYTIVDYKTDHSIIPLKYKKQQDCYKKALCSLFNVQPQCVKQVLYYVRYDYAVEI